LIKAYNQKHNNSHQNIHFLHGNSFTPNSYQKLLDKISKESAVKTSLLRPLWNKNDLIQFSNWDIFLKDYLDAIKDENNIIGLGHSIGGNLLLKAAILKPDKFDKIILLDPTFFPPFTIWAWKIISLLKMQPYFLSYIKYAENKRMQYNSIEEIFTSYRRRKVFSKFSDEDLLLLVKSLIVVKNDKVNLIFDNKWDAQIYTTGLVNDMFIWRNIKNLKTKTLIIRAEYSDVFYKKTSKLVLKKNPAISIKTIKGSDHLFPINNYLNTFKLIKSFLND
jgi:pimeloyl-ACP methyl ester carboxylesterase